jgi:serine protease Do
LLLLVGLILVGCTPAHDSSDNLADLVEDVRPAVVNISIVRTSRPTSGREEFEEFFRDFFEGLGERQSPPQPSLGSGVIIDASGYIVTSYRLIDGADEITVRLNDGTALVAQVVGSDELTNLALLRAASGRPLPVAKWGDSDRVRIGEEVIAIGNPFGLGGSVSTGIVSGRERDIRQGPYDDFIQTDANISQGSLGGPLFNLDGRVIGINSAIVSPSDGSANIGFATASNLARDVVEQLRSLRRVRRAWLGVRVQTVTDELAEGLRLGRATGALVASVTEGGPAEIAGIGWGDVIIEFDGRDITEMRQLPRIVAETGIGKTVEVVVWRTGRLITFQVKLGELDEERLAAATMSTAPVEALGLTLVPLTPELRAQLEVGEDADGVVILGVIADSTAAEKGLRPGDVIVEVDQERVRTPGDVADQIGLAMSDGFRVVTLLLLREGDFQWVALRLYRN